ncbi:hypothetical protein [Vibrio maritimus]|uniref:hypothetical protein n=1 Tax=Vibrio maritimus TaxID=990268 RepID=UPI00373663A6
MQTRFYEDSYKGINSIVLENDQIRAEWLPSNGAKLASLITKTPQGNIELLFQSEQTEIATPNYGDCFAEFDTSGFDECFPTIQECDIVLTEQSSSLLMPDHGEVWAMPWKLERLAENRLAFSVFSERFGYILTKQVTLTADGLDSHYVVSLANDRAALPFIWTPHALFAVYDNHRFITPERMNEIINVCEGGGELGKFGAIYQYPKTTTPEKRAIDLSLMEPVEANNCEKYYFTDLLEKGDQFGFENCHCRVMMMVSEDVVPYLGIWKNQSGFKGHYNFALEPCSGAYDSTASAYKNGRCAILEPGETVSWHFDLTITSAVEQTQ